MKNFWEALKKDFEIHRVNKKFVKSLTEKVNSNGMRITVKMIERYRESVAGQGSGWMGGDSAMESELLPPFLVMTLRVVQRTSLPMQMLWKITSGREITSM